jgi:hypothetical protein
MTFKLAKMQLKLPSTGLQKTLFRSTSQKVASWFQEMTEEPSLNYRIFTAYQELKATVT